VYVYRIAKRTSIYRSVRSTRSARTRARTYLARRGRCNDGALVVDRTIELTSLEERRAVGSPLPEPPG